MKTSARAVMLLCGLLSGMASGCLYSKPLKWNQTNNESYRRNVSAWTRTDDIADGMNSLATTRVTCFSPSFTRAIQTERAMRRKMSATEIADQLAVSKSLTSDYLDFFVAMHTQNFHWNDLDQKNGTFQIKLFVDDLEAMNPVKIERLTDNELADWRTLFPKIGPLETGYFVRFPAPKAPRNLKLIIAGDPGAMEMAWIFAP